jgi:hypothetical protein
LIGRQKDAIFEIDLRRNPDAICTSIKIAKVGICSHAISGNIFWMHDSMIDKIDELIYTKCDE